MGTNSHNNHPLKAIVTLMLSFPVCFNGFAQKDSLPDLYRVLRTNDSLLFDVGFNTCDLQQFESLISSDFEFFHDEAGITNSKAAFIESIEEKICQINYRPIRKVLEGTIEVYPLEKNGALYGAIQYGRHEFYAIEKNQPEQLTSSARFMHIWMLENGIWKLSRAYSFDHEESQADEGINKMLLFRNRKETEKWLRSLGVPALGIGYIKDGKIKEVTVYGELEKEKPAPANTIFNVASLTKPVTALVALKLVNAGKWNLDEPLFKYWTDPDIADDARTQKLTARHVLSHQSGFPNWRYQNDSGKLAFEFEPGTKYQYSGEGFEYLRKSLEKRFNKTLDQLASELIFEPLEMNDTRFFWDKSVEESRFAKWHNDKGELYKTYKNETANAADDLLTTVSDYCRFLIYVMEGAGLSPELYNEMISDQTQVKANQHFGLGWMIDENMGKGEYAITHGGDDKGVHAIVFMLPVSKQGLVIFTNGDNGTATYIETILFYLNDLGQRIIDVETK